MIHLVEGGKHVFPESLLELLGPHANFIFKHRSELISSFVYRYLMVIVVISTGCLFHYGILVRNPRANPTLGSWFHDLLRRFHWILSEEVVLSKGLPCGRWMKYFTPARIGGPSQQLGRPASYLGHVFLAR